MAATHIAIGIFGGALGMTSSQCDTVNANETTKSKGRLYASLFCVFT